MLKYLPILLEAILRGLAANGNLAIATASSNLGIRALMIWRRKRYVQYIIAFLCVGHLVFAILLGILGIRVTWDDNHTICTMVDTVKDGLFSFFLSTIGIDLAILLFTVVGLQMQERSSAGISPLWSALVTQSLAYTALTCITGIPMAVLSRLDLNFGMNMIFVVPGSTISVMASSAVVTSLFRNKELGMESSDASNDSPRSDATDMGRKSYRSSDQLSTHISLSSMEYTNSCDIADSRFDVDRAGQSCSSITIGGKGQVRVLESDGHSSFS